MRVLLGNEPRAYRDVLRAALHELRPQIDVVSAEPEQLDEATLELSPDLVICSELSEVVEKQAPAWIVLYPEGTHVAAVSLVGNRLVMDGLEFPRLLSVIDEAEKAVSST